MKSKPVTGMMLMLLVANAFVTAFLITHTAAEADAPGFPNYSPTFQEADGTDLPNPVAPERSSHYDGLTDDDADQDPWTEDHFGRDAAPWENWDFSDVDEWRDRASGDEDSVELVVGIDNTQPHDVDELEKLMIGHGGEIVNTVSIGGEIRAAVADVPLVAVFDFVTAVQGATFSRYVEPNLKFQATFVPNDPYWSWQWGPAKIQADYAWNTTIGDPSVLVAVIDTGIDWNHPDLDANYVALGYDWVNNDADPMDDNGHGTHCAGIIAAELDNGVGIAGLAQVHVMAEKGLDWGGYGTEDDLANAIAHAADQGARILSLSWGGYTPSVLIHEAVIYAYDRDILVIASAGNDGVDLESYPAAYDEVVAVTATDEYDAPAWWTNFGEWVEVSAPGVNIYSTIWDDSYAFKDGTSMAAPHVSGTAALIWSQFPFVTRDWVRVQLRYTADDLGAPGFDEYYGYGRINARMAVEQAPTDHELLIFDWDSPPYVKLGESATFDITVLNFGASDETGVEVQLLANGSLVDSTSIASLPGGASSTVGLSWTPTTEGAWNVTSYVVPVPGESITHNNQVTAIVPVIVPPPDTGWLPLATDPDEGTGCNLKAVYGQEYTGIIYFKVECHRAWTTINDINVGLMIDADQDPYTGLPDGYYPDQNTGMGADYLMVIGYEATEMWKWDPMAGWWDIDNPIALAYLDAPDDSNVFVAGVYRASVETAETLDCAVCDTLSDWDWMPDVGHFSWTLIRYEHELIVFLQTPQHLQPGETSPLNATVANFGLNTETSVELFLLLDDTIVDTVTIPELVNGTAYTLEYLWTPTVEAMYNVTAYAPPVPDENVTANNVLSAYVNVRYLDVALFKNVDPWEYPANEEALSLYDIAYAVFRSSDFGRVDLRAFSKVIIAADQDQTFYSDLDAYRWWFEDYVAGGGILEIHAADWGWNGGGWVGLLPGGLEWVQYSANYVTIVDPTHPVVTTPNLITDNELDEWWSSVHGYFATYPEYTHIVITEDYTGYPAYLEFDYGAGTIVASSQTLEWAYMWRDSLILENSLLYIPVKYPHELVATLEVPTTVRPGDSSLLSATVYNDGLSLETDVELFLLINGTTVDSVTISELVNGTAYTLEYLWTPTVEAMYNVTAYAPPVPDENVTANNRMSKLVNVRYLPRLLVVDTPWPEDTGALDILGYEYTLITPTELATVNLYDYDVLFVGWLPGDIVVNALLAKASEIADWIAAGNGIVALAEFEEVNRWAWLPLYVSGSSGFHADTVEILNPAHPVMANLTDADLSNWGNSYHGYFLSYDPALEPLAEGVEAGYPITLAATYGAGRIVITDQDPDYHLYYIHEEGAGKLLRNMIEWTNLAMGWDVALTATIEDYYDVSEFGMRSDATDEFDTAYDAVDPPEPPGSGVVSYFWYPDNPVAPVDLRRLCTSKIPPSPLMTWTYRVKSKGISGSMVIRWSAEDIATIPPEHGVYLQCPDGSVIDMRAQTEYALLAELDITYAYTITVGPTSYDLQLSAGWNLVSFAVLPTDTDFASIFSDVGFYQVYTWDGSHYVVPDVAEAGWGYWVLVLADTTVRITGTPVMSYERDLPAGWSLIGSIYPGVVDAGLVFPDYYQLYAWDGASYVASTTIDPWKGYWALVLEPTPLVIDESYCTATELIYSRADINVDIQERAHSNYRSSLCLSFGLAER